MVFGGLHTSRMMQHGDPDGIVRSGKMATMFLDRYEPCPPSRCAIASETGGQCRADPVAPGHRVASARGGTAAQFRSARGAHDGGTGGVHGAAAVPRFGLVSGEYAQPRHVILI